MGDFFGHATPGTFFLVFGFWWAFAAIRRYLVCKRDGVQFVSSLVYTYSRPNRDGQTSSGAKSCKAFCASLPVEAVAKAVFSFVGMGLEICGHLPPPLPSRIKEEDAAAVAAAADDDDGGDDDDDDDDDDGDEDDDDDNDDDDDDDEEEEEVDGDNDVVDDDDDDDDGDGDNDDGGDDDDDNDVDDDDDADDDDNDDAAAAAADDDEYNE
ncbi:hypothetical protein ElyMa_000999400 [Elysia marginata]|uniref:Uncharacterized protein n=1 Tax=Elysia marginata TaxID=1093978 RepID=A0AAV4HJY9_9GAST|nr:hypothetical protein ElyMa_000999400 [Elysia marginata]